MYNFADLNHDDIKTAINDTKETIERAKNSPAFKLYQNNPQMRHIADYRQQHISQLEKELWALEDEHRRRI